MQLHLTFIYANQLQSEEDLNRAIADINGKLNLTYTGATPSAVPPARKKLRLDTQIYDQPVCSNGNRVSFAYLITQADGAARIDDGTHYETVTRCTVSSTNDTVSMATNNISTPRAATATSSASTPDNVSDSPAKVSVSTMLMYG